MVGGGRPKTDHVGFFGAHSGLGKLGMPWTIAFSVVCGEGHAALLQGNVSKIVYSNALNL